MPCEGAFPFILISQAKHSMLVCVSFHVPQLYCLLILYCLFASMQFLLLLAEANASSSTSALRHPAISESDDVMFDIFSLAAKCIDKSPVNRPTMAVVHPFLASLETKLYGHDVPMYAERVEKDAAMRRFEAPISLEDEWSQFALASNTTSKGSSSMRTSSNQSSMVVIRSESDAN